MNTSLDEILVFPLSLKEAENKSLTRIGRNVFISHFYSDFRDAGEEEQQRLVNSTKANKDGRDDD